MKTINTYMKRMTVAASFLLAAMLLLMTGCKEDTPTSLYDPNYQGGPQPVVESIVSSNGPVIFAGLSNVTINGQNFSTDPTHDLVYFDQKKATVISATSTQLVVKAPVYVKDSIKLAISVQGAAKYSDVKLVKIDAAVADYGKLGATEEAVAIATDNAGNVYASMKNSGVGIGIRKFMAGPDTGYSYAPSGGVTSWSGMKIGPGGVLFGARVQRALYTIPQNAASVLWAQAAGSSLADIDFDNLGNLWAVGGNANIYRFKVADKSVATFPFTATLRSVRVYNGYVFVAGKKDSTEGVWRLPLNADGTLGAAQLFFDLTSQVGSKTVTANVITFNTDGEMYLGTNQLTDAILLVAPDGKSYQPYYPGLIAGPIISFAWGSGSTLYATRGGNEAVTKSIVKIVTLKASAPYYGQQ